MWGGLKYSQYRIAESNGEYLLDLCSACGSYIVDKLYVEPDGDVRIDFGGNRIVAADNHFVQRGKWGKELK